MALIQEAAGRNYLDGSSEGPVCTPKTMTPVEKVSRTLSDARDLSSRVRTIVDGLIGSQPEKDGDPGRGISGGILISLADNAEDTLTELRRAHDELSRLSKVLGLGL